MRRDQVQLIYTPSHLFVIREETIQLIATPERSLLQRQDALVRANTVRTKRAELKKDLKAGRVNILDLFRNPPEYVQTMKLNALLLSVPKLGQVKVNRILVQCRISPSRTLEGITKRQREEIVAKLLRK